jgi:hypothetical protein
MTVHEGVQMPTEQDALERSREGAGHVDRVVYPSELDEVAQSRRRSCKRFPTIVTLDHRPVARIRRQV